MSYLAELQDPAMAQLKAGSANSHVPSHDATFADGAMRGRADYSNLDALRTKPGRADAPSSTSMSCSDKIASWNVTGLQGALLAGRVEPVFLRQIVVSLAPQIGATQELHLKACQRALSGRTQAISGCKAAFSLLSGGIEVRLIRNNVQRIPLRHWRSSGPAINSHTHLTTVQPP